MIRAMTEEVMAEEAQEADHEECGWAVGSAESDELDAHPRWGSLGCRVPRTVAVLCWKFQDDEVGGCGGACNH